MKIVAVNVTYCQPILLGRMIECFNRQTHENRSLFSLEDGRQLPWLHGNKWTVWPHRLGRFSTLGRKRNAAVRTGLDDWHDEDVAYAVMDTDDIYLPNHLSACVAALQDAPWCQPSQILIQDCGRFKRMLTYQEDTPDRKAYHGGWAFRREAFKQLGGYADMNNGEDAELAGRALKLFGPSADTISPEFPDPTYSYTTAGLHLSAMGAGGYAKLGRQKIEPVAELDISWPEDYSKWPIDDEVLPRNW